MLYHGSNRDLCVRKQFFHRVRQQVSAGMANHLQTIGVLGGDDRQSTVRIDQVAGVNHLAVHLPGKRCLGQTRANRSRHLGNGYRLRKLTY